MDTNINSANREEGQTAHRPLMRGADDRRVLGGYVVRQTQLQPQQQLQQQQMQLTLG